MSVFSGIQHVDVHLSISVAVTHLRRLPGGRERYDIELVSSLRLVCERRLFERMFSAYGSARRRR